MADWKAMESPKEEAMTPSKEEEQKLSFPQPHVRKKIKGPIRPRPLSTHSVAEAAGDASVPSVASSPADNAPEAVVCADDEPADRVTAVVDVLEDLADTSGVDTSGGDSNAASCPTTATGVHEPVAEDEAAAKTSCSIEDGVGTLGAEERRTAVVSASNFIVVGGLQDGKTHLAPQRLRKGDSKSEDRGAPPPVCVEKLSERSVKPVSVTKPIVRINGGEVSDYVWLAQLPPSACGAAGEWQPLRISDQKRLEAAEAARRAKGAYTPKGRRRQPLTATSFSAVPVDGGRAEVRLEDRLLSDRYGADPPRRPRPVRRAIWFRSESGTSWEPYEEDVGRRVEQMYARVLRQVTEDETPTASSKFSESLELEGEGKTIKVDLAFESAEKPAEAEVPLSLTWRLTASECQPDSSSFAWSKLWGSNQIAVKRGHSEVCCHPHESEEDVLSSNVDRVYILVHGIGEKIWSTDGTGLAHMSNTLRLNMHQRRLRLAGYAQNSRGDGWVYSSEEPEPAGTCKPEILEASWWEAVHTEEKDERLNRITLPSMPQIRKFTNSAICDAMVYMSNNAKRNFILATVQQSINTAFARFQAHHPAFSGEVVLIGHSLGGVILFELLRRAAPPLNLPMPFSFSPLAIFTLGSPTGIFMHCADDVPEPSFTLPGGTLFFNMFHPQDPVAYRVEPLFAPEFENVPPEQVPSEGSRGGVKAHHSVKNLMRWALGEDQKSSESVKAAKLMLNNGCRVDWVLQADLSVIGTFGGQTGELLQARANHACYCASPDVAAFIETQSSIAAGDSVEKPQPSGGGEGA
eukprot:TRINITY_DN22779_c1_g1_i1.p1 TRINITY_DN22779_c1_g1~~TRINITY_DN22779_c1_g1_i1.p1  ORF type:complete len:803 (-),score=147.00 TRINITY_DN22779_c1_g1_i1:198-2606(-)